MIRNYLYPFFQNVFPNANYLVLAVLLLAAILTLLGLLSLSRFKHQRPNLVLGIVIIGLLLMIMVVALPNRWQWVAGLLPMLMVGYQLFYLWLYHPKEVVGSAPDVSDRDGQSQDISEKSYRRAQDSIDSHFSLRTLFTRYGLPAVLLGITGIVLSDILIRPNDFFSVQIQYLGSNETDVRLILRGLRLGALGAYVFVLMELGRRTFRHDITGASAMWSWVTLVLGPALAATVALLWRVEGAPETTGWWGSGIVLFFTGFAPRRVVAAVEQAAAQLLKIGPTTVVETRLIPLSKIRGISPQIEDRLGEEGILDVNSLAAAEPVRLMRNTSFDMRLILTWIDEAILIVTLPRSWESLEEEGIRGAVDLSKLYDQVVDEQGRLLPASLEDLDSPPASVRLLPPSIRRLSAKAKLEDPANFAAAIKRLHEDTQVQYIQALNKHFTEFAGGDPKKTNWRPSKVNVDSPPA